MAVPTRPSSHLPGLTSIRAALCLATTRSRLRLPNLTPSPVLSVYNSRRPVERVAVDPTKTANLWIPVCCERVMRFNIFMQKTGTAYGSLVCTVCNKSVSFELEHQAAL